MKIKVRLWNSPYNGGWIWFDRKQIKCFRFGGFSKDYKYAYLNNGEPEIDRTIYWCIFGFCGRFTLQTWPW